VGVFPATKILRYGKEEAVYTTLLMSTGLTFGTISALYGLTHGIIDQAQYSYLVATVIASAVIPTIIANAFFLPRHHLPATLTESAEAEETARAEEAAAAVDLVSR
jgi:Kef-type K+ transport system membrane component KefB